MADQREIRTITLGGKGCLLSSASVVAVANGLAQVRIDSSAVDRLAASSNNRPPSVKSHISIPKLLTREEARASLVVLLNKLLLSGSSIRPVLPVLISETLNSDSQALCFEELNVTEEENVVLEKSSAVLDGISAMLDHESSALSTIADAVSALSCEALRADVTAFNSIDSGDGNVAKDENGVASDMKVLLNGSKLVGKVECGAVSEIPKIHGSLREAVRLVHSRTRVELNSGVKCGKGAFGTGGIGKAWATVLSPMAAVLRYLGESCLSRAKLNVNSINNDALRSGLVEMVDQRCPGFDNLKDAFRIVLDAVFEEDYVKFMHEINALVGMIRGIVAWEAVTAFVSLEASELIDRSQGGGALRVENGGAVNVDKKSEKRKKVLGKGSNVIVQLIKDRLQSAGQDAGDALGLLEKWVRDIFSLLNPKEQELDGLLKKIKEIVESNESRRLPKLPKGTRDFAKEQMAIREKAFSIIVDVFKRHGATALDTPAFELRETLMGKYGEESKLIYDLADQGGELCSLRYDLTVPFARYVAMNGITSFKRYQIAKVYRRDNPSKGRYREFYQCDFDIAGQFERMGPDFEVIKILTELLDELDIGDYEVKLNHRQLLDGMLDICGVPSEKFRTICSSIDKLDKLSFAQIKKEMVEEKGLSVETADKIGTFVKERGSPLELLSKLKQEGSKFLTHNVSVLALNELEILFKALEKSKCIGKVVFDLSLARGLDYYTGVICEAVFKGVTQVGSIAAGGRYDNLIGMFGTKQVPAVGVSLGIERVFTIMEQLQKDQKQATRATETQVLVAILGDDLSQAAELVSELWNAKLKAEYMVNKRVMKHIDRAKESRIPWMIIVGEREINEGIVKLKDIEANKEEVVPRSKVVEELQRRLVGV
ncbi:histidine--tRNA ligase, cytoplasmic [Malania oleifera]|uniref:histidine--tRNA ligase, cytoplasmic n=1 Tax=Malania oleifera TaxID=397392 RepID=UPI0025AE8182|nr:histidine--tRNA ligase, cytoplasmic [Malania oleifera]